jgi:hypothetical protein
VQDVSDICDLLFALRPGSVLAPGSQYAALLPHALPGHAGGTLRPETMPGAAAPITAGTSVLANGHAAANGQAAGATGGAVSLGAADKVAAVCAAIRTAVMAAAGASRYLKVVVTSYARRAICMPLHACLAFCVSQQMVPIVWFCCVSCWGLQLRWVIALHCCCTSPAPPAG